MEEKSYFHPDEKFEYRNIPKNKIEEWAEKATRYDKLVKAYLKENYMFETDKIELFTSLDILIQRLLEADFEYFAIINGPDGCDEVDHYYKRIN